MFVKVEWVSVKSRKVQAAPPPPRKQATKIVTTEAGNTAYYTPTLHHPN